MGRHKKNCECAGCKERQEQRDLADAHEQIESIDEESEEI